MPIVRPKFLALDLGGSTGYAYLPQRSSTTPEFGTWCLDEDAGGSRSYIPAQRLRDQLEVFSREEYGFTAIAFEETFARGEAKLRLDSMQTVVGLYCLDHHYSWMRITASSLKKFATGNGRSGKEQMVDAARVFFPTLKRARISFDEADALCVLAWAIGISPRE
jgi:Holliday junction resolvasome RuvABC endonuclease subunit